MLCSVRPNKVYCLILNFIKKPGSRSSPANSKIFTIGNFLFAGGNLDKKMNNQDIYKNIKWDEYGIGYVSILVPLFEKEIEFELFSEDDKNPSITSKMLETIEDVVKLPPDCVEKVKELLWEECNFSFTVADYGCEPKDGETCKDAHFREFELYDAQDSFTKSKIKRVQIHYESDTLEGRFAEIKIETATANLISIIVKNGKIIDYDNDGTYLGWFDANEQKAHNDRMKVLNE
jgi:hypothetical protein